MSSDSLLFLFIIIETICTNIQKQFGSQNVLSPILEIECKQMYVWVEALPITSATEKGKTDYSPAPVKYIGNNTQ